MQTIDLFGHVYTVAVVVDEVKTEFKSKAEKKKHRPQVHVQLLDPKNKIVARGVAICGPNDEFDPEYGTKIAFQRAIDRAAAGLVKGVKTRLTNELFGGF